MDYVSAGLGMLAKIFDVFQILGDVEANTRAGEFRFETNRRFVHAVQAEGLVTGSRRRHRAARP